MKRNWRVFSIHMREDFVRERREDECHKNNGKSFIWCPMVITEVPSEPWHTVGADLFQFKGMWYLILTDVYSKAPFVRPLANIDAYATVINI